MQSLQQILQKVGMEYLKIHSKLSYQLYVARSMMTNLPSLILQEKDTDVRHSRILFSVLYGVLNTPVCLQREVHSHAL